MGGRKKKEKEGKKKIRKICQSGVGGESRAGSAWAHCWAWEVHHASTGVLQWAVLG